MHLTRLAVVACLAGVMATPASAIESTIIPGVGVGRVKLGMTFTQVKKELGGSPFVNKRMQIRGHGYIEYSWAGVWVGFLNTKGILHATLIGTNRRSERTTEGIGVGASSTALKREVPVRSCWAGDDGVYRPYDGPAAYCVFGRQGAVTVFEMRGTECKPPDHLPGQWICKRYWIKDVLVTKTR